jgi:hypothetical protein
MNEAALDALQRAVANEEEARTRLMDATKLAFPEGARVRYSYRRNNKTHDLYGEVTGYGGQPWGWHGIGDIYVMNEASGKSRRVNAAFYAARGELELLSLPAGVGGNDGT